MEFVTAPLSPAAQDKWYESPFPVVIRRCGQDYEAAQVISDGLSNGWTVLSHNVVATPSMGIWILVLILSRRTEHVITFVKRGTEQV